MRTVFLKYTLLGFFLAMSVSAFPQKEVRKEVRKGNKAYKQEKYSEAYSFYDKAVKTNANSLEANYNLANALYRQKEWDKAVEQYNHYLMLEKENPQKMSAAWHNIGNALLQKKDLQKSMEAYKMALRLNPSDDETRYNLAVVQKLVKDQQNNQQNQDQQNKDQQDKDKKQDQQKQNEDQQKQQQQQNPDQNDKDKKAEQQQQPEQMSRENARQMLQAIEQDEKDTQEKVRQMKAEERKQQADDNRKRSKDW